MNPFKKHPLLSAAACAVALSVTSYGAFQAYVGTGRRVLSHHVANAPTVAVAALPAAAALEAIATMDLLPRGREELIREVRSGGMKIVEIRLTGHLDALEQFQVAVGSPDRYSLI